MQKDSQEENWQQWRQRDEQVQLTAFAVFGFPEICYSIKLSVMYKERWLERNKILPIEGNISVEIQAPSFVRYSLESA